MEMNNYLLSVLSLCDSRALLGSFLALNVTGEAPSPKVDLLEPNVTPQSFLRHNNFRLLHNKLWRPFEHPLAIVQVAVVIESKFRIARTPYFSIVVLLVLLLPSLLGCGEIILNYCL